MPLKCDVCGDMTLRRKFWRGTRLCPSCRETITTDGQLYLETLERGLVMTKGKRRRTSELLTRRLRALKARVDGQTTERKVARLSTTRRSFPTKAPKIGQF